MLKENEIFALLEEMLVIKNKLDKSQLDENTLIEQVVEAESTILGKTVMVKDIEGIVIDVDLLGEYFVMFATNGNEANHRINFSDL